VTEWSVHGGEKFGGKHGTDKVKASGAKKTGEQVLQMPHVSLSEVEDIMAALSDAPFVRTPRFAFDTVEATVKYSSYLDRQEQDMESWRKSQNLPIPPNIVYDRATFPSFKEEELEKLQRHRPKNFSEANLIGGMRPTSLVSLYHIITKKAARSRGQKGVTTSVPS
jgi:tRNA uridine 5-carboxymethylaminomethyl modification enzyme